MVTDNWPQELDICQHQNKNEYRFRIYFRVCKFWKNEAKYWENFRDARKIVFCDTFRDQIPDPSLKLAWIMRYHIERNQCGTKDEVRQQ